MPDNYILTDNDEGKILPRLQTLRFIKSNPVSDKPAFDNRQLSEEDYSNYVLITENQKLNTGDPILIQIITNYTTKNVILVDSTGSETDLTGAVASKSTAWSEITSWVTTDYDTLYVYNKTIYTGLLSGSYYIRLELEESDSANDLQYTSNVFVVGNYSDYPILSWTHSVTGLRKGIYFSGVETFYTRIDSRFCTFAPGIDLTVNDSWNKSLSLVDADSKFYAVMELDNLPRYLLEKLNCILQVNTKTIDEEQYEVEEGIQAQLIRDELIVTSIYKGQLRWRKKNYEKYPDIEAEEEIEIPYILINSDDDDYITYNDDDDYLIYTDE